MTIRMTTRCACRYNCNHHECTYSYTEKDKSIPGFCVNAVNGHYLRFACEKCPEIRIMELCDSCWDRCKRWMESNSTTSCENCRTSGYCGVRWVMYEDAAS